MSRGTGIERFFDRLVIGDGCWTLDGKPDKDGYTRIRDKKNSAVYGHRFSYEFFIGKISDGLCIDHLCRNRACVNPSHLDPVSLKENNLRGVGPAAWNAVKSKCIRGHTLGPSGGRQRTCRRCTNSLARDRAARERAMRGVKPRALSYCGTTGYWDVRT